MASLLRAGKAEGRSTASINVVATDAASEGPGTPRSVIPLEKPNPLNLFCQARSLAFLSGFDIVPLCDYGLSFQCGTEPRGA
jgi:hypothetical protein